MHSVSLRIEGNFWESFIYSGRLYLWDMSGEILTVDWDALIDSLKERHNANRFLDFAFVNGNDLYQSANNPILEDREIRLAFQKRLAEIDGKEFLITRNELNSFIIDQTDYKYLPNSIDIYNNKIYSATDEGLWETNIMRRSGGKVSSRSQLIQSEGVFDLRINRNRILLSCGKFGLLRYDIEPTADRFDPEKHLPNEISEGPFEEVNERTYRLTPNNSMSANWCYSSVVNQGAGSDFEFIGFSWHSNFPKLPYSNTRLHLVFKGTFDIKTFLPEARDVKYCFGYQEKLYFVRENEIDVFRFTQKHLSSDDKSPFELLKEHKAFDMGEEIYSAEASFFGIIIETKTGVHWYRSNNESIKLGSKITSMKAFPRSKNYENQIHIILEDALVIQSDLNDYFMDQKEKIFGIKHWSPRVRNDA